MMPPPDNKPLWETLDLDRHAVIEASAGTGKTYTIENLVVRLLSLPEPRAVRLDEILVVTFTEKATGELRDRIRQKVEDSLTLELDTGTRCRLEVARADFDAAQIFTIHGFCYRFLQQFAFENDHPLEGDISSDSSFYGRLFKQQLRTRWPTEVFPQVTADERRQLHDRSFFETDIVQLASGKRSTDVLLPGDLPPETRLTLLDDVLSKLASLMGDSFVDDYCRLDFGKGAVSGFGVKSVRPIWEPLHGIVSEYRDGRPVDQQMADELAAWYAGIDYKRFWRRDADGSERFRVLIPPRYREGYEPRADFAACPSFPDVVDVLAARLEPLLWPIDGIAAAIASSAERLITDVDTYKRGNGVVTFDDLLVRVDQALGNGLTPAADALRRKYRYVLVDEFQDTDPVQWSIFRRAFVETDTEHRLFLIGDPKQAIYGFRGADVWTYLDARAEIVRRCGSGSVVSLAHNWRSVPELIDAFNGLFACPAWFGKGDADSARQIAYETAETPCDADRKARLYDDRTGRSAVTAVHVDAGDGKLTGGIPLRRMARFAAAEIARLMFPEPLLDIEAPDECVRRLLRYSDIAVLVRSRREARVVERAFDAHDPPIPHSHYKKPGVYQSAEAAHIAYLIRAVAEPGDESARRAALLTRFFRHTLTDLQTEDALDDPDVRDLFDRWAGLCGPRHWAGLFRSFLEDTGILFRESTEQDGERRVTNYEHILQDLAAEALTRNLDIAGILELLEFRRHRSIEIGQDADLHRLETEEPKVQIMTMHSAKGLQFSVVFVVGGFSGGGSGGQFITYHDDDGRRVFEIKTDRGLMGRARALQEGAEEDKRLFYVALTRARYKLYVPWHEASGKANAPVTSFLLESLRNVFPDSYSDPVAGHADWSETGSVEVRWQPRCDPEPVRDTTPEPEPTRWADELGAEHLLPPEVGDLARWQRRVSSFSRLAHHRDEGSIGTAAEYPGRPEMDVEATRVPADASLVTDRSVPVLLPPGAKAGTVLHEILEAIDFAEVARASDPDELIAESAPARRVILDAMARNGLSERRVPATEPGEASSTSEAVARLAWHALHTELDNSGLRLAYVSPGDRKVEQEFYVREPGDGDGLLHGIIDLVFRHEGRYYILDWKTNWLEDGYSTDSVRRSMEQEDYLLQVRMYTIAVVEWLRTSVPGFGMDSHFGGIYYLYLRGLTGVGMGEGIYFDRPDERTLERYRAYVLARLGGHDEE